MHRGNGRDDITSRRWASVYDHTDIDNHDNNVPAHDDHTISVFDRDYQLLATISDEVTPAAFGHADDSPGSYLGSPVEAAFTSNGSYACVSNYRMYGGDLSTAASDGCNQGNWPDSIVYRIDTSILEIDQLLRVGSVPKFLTVTMSKVRTSDIMETEEHRVSDKPIASPTTKAYSGTIEVFQDAAP